MAVMGALSSYPLMVAGRVVIGVTEGPQFGTAIATVKRWYAPREQALGNAMMVLAAVGAAGTTLVAKASSLARLLGLG